VGISINKQIGKLLAVGLALTCLISVMFALTAFAADTSHVTLTAEQIIVNNGSSVPTRTTFAYRMIPKTTDAPMPNGSGLQGYTFTITGADEKPIGPISFSAPGIFVYELSCITDSELDFITDRRIYTVEVHVTNDHGLQITTVVYISPGNKVSAISFEHVYTAFSGGSEMPGNPGGQGGSETPGGTPGTPGQTDPPKPPDPQDNPELPGPSEESPEPVDPQDKPETPDQPDDPQDNPEGVLDQHETPGTSPSTGDFSNPTLWIILITISGILLLFIASIDRKLKGGRSN
jgi:hypothetical protein